MKWTKPGNEFDIIGKNLCNKSKKYILWGAGKAGQIFFDRYSERLNIIAFIDSDNKKIDSEYRGIPILNPDSLIENPDAIVIICVLGYYAEIEEHLKKLNYIKYENYLYTNEFTTLYEMYAEDKLVCWHVNVPITDKCTLRCKDCSVFIPYIENPQHRDILEIQQDIDSLFHIVDEVPELHLLGGEPVLHKELPELIVYIGERYRDKIGELAIATNGTLLASKELLYYANKYDVSFIISDYTSSAHFDGRQRSKELCLQLEENGIEYTYAVKDKWYDFGCPSEVDLKVSEKKLKERFSGCRSINRILINNRLYYCHHQVGAVWAELTEDNCDGYIDLNDIDDKKVLMEYSLGFTEKGYLDFCRHCYGYDGINDRIIPSAEQL
ncbi:MAG: radical SAM protein [Anaerovoracaceae bacterium]